MKMTVCWNEEEAPLKRRRTRLHGATSRQTVIFKEALILKGVSPVFKMELLTVKWLTA
jgi:hypothetical protein